MVMVMVLNYRSYPVSVFWTTLHVTFVQRITYLLDNRSGCFCLQSQEWFYLRKWLEGILLLQKIVRNLLAWLVQWVQDCRRHCRMKRSVA